MRHSFNKKITKYVVWEMGTKATGGKKAGKGQDREGQGSRICRQDGIIYLFPVLSHCDQDS